MATSNSVWPTCKAVGWRALVLMGAWLGFEGLVELRKWHESYAISKPWAGELRGADQKWSPVLADAALRNVSEKPLASADDMYEILAADVAEAKNWANPPEHLKAYHEARKTKNTLIEERDRRFKGVDVDFEPLSFTRAAIVSLREEIAKETDPNALATKTKELNTLTVAQAKLGETLAALNAERAAIELGYAKRIETAEKSITAAEAGLRKAFDAGAKYARPVSPGRTAAFRMHAGNDDDARHILFVLLWYGIEGAILLGVFSVFVTLLLATAGPGSTPGQVKQPFLESLKQLLARFLGPRIAGGAGRAAAALVLGTAGVVGISAAAGDSPAVIPSVSHHVESVEGAKGEKGDAGALGTIPPEIEKQLADHAAALDAQARLLIEQRKTIDDAQRRLGEVAKKAEQTAHAAAKLASDARMMTANIDGLANAATSTGRVLGQLDDGLNQVVAAQQWTLFAGASAARRIDRSILGLQQVTASTAEGVTHVAQRAEAIAEEDTELHAASLQVASIGDGFLRAINPFDRYRLNDTSIELVMKATNRTTPQAALLADGLRRAAKEKPMRIRAFRKKVHETTDPAARPLVDHLMPLILRVSRVRGGQHVASGN